MSHPAATSSPPPPPRDATTELVFGRYEPQARLAIGGMGEVFLAVQRGVPGFERAVILKSLLPELAAQPGFIDQFLDEARVASQLNHPNVVSIYEVGLWNGTYFIAMEYIRGRNLAQVSRRAAELGLALPPVVVARIIADAARGLGHAHLAHGADGTPLQVIHRDVSPHNIMTRVDGVTKVVDFGIARAANRATRTRTGTLKGKLSYMAPEQVLERPLTPAVDQFALGVCFWELLTGRPLFRAENDLKIIKQVLERPIERPSQLRPGLPAAYDRIALRMLEREPLERFPDMGAAAAALTELVSEFSSSGDDPVAAFMQALGTDDLAARPGPSRSKNFVISLEPREEDLPEVEIVTATLAPRRSEARGVEAKAGPRARRWPLVLAAALVVAAVLAVVGVRQSPEAPAPPVATPAPVAVTPAPIAPPPPPALGRLEVTTRPPGAAVFIDGQRAGSTPLSLPVAAEVPHQVKLELAGFADVEQTFTLSPGMTRAIELQLAALKAVRPRAPAPEPPAPPRVVDEAPRGPGLLSLSTEPWSMVTIDGADAESTPVVQRSLPAGRHTLTLVNEEQGLKDTRVIEIAPGQHLKLRIALKR
ncbi:MAG: serine/threonine-protein kinase [Myxococcaceae bacterium]|nr:serine/threonine-protein kinase [Myxococcaceae bacterium]